MENDIDLTSFEAYWEQMSEKEKVRLIESSALLGPDLAISPVLKGLDSHLFPVRSQARKTLGFIRSRIHALLNDPSDNSKLTEGMKSSARVCAQIFSRLVPGIPVKEQQYSFKILLKFDGSGAHFAFKALYLNRIDISIVEKIMVTAPETDRLRFIGAYLKADPILRLKYGSLFRKIVASVKESDSIIKFYADLFDAQQDADPFLFNLDAEARDPDRIVTSLVRSKSPGVRIRGLKALAMIVPKISPGLILDLLKNETDLLVRKTIYRIIENSSLGTYPEVFDPILLILGKSDPQESYHAFKALMVSGKKPLYQVLDIVQKDHPALLGHIYREISELSKISFFFIQDIALNKKIYFENHFEINLALVFGMIKKRPERVVKILKDHSNEMDNTLRKGVDQFIKKTNQLLTKEKKSIILKFAAIRKQLETRPEESKSLLQNLFSSNTLPKKIEALKKGNRLSSLDFEGETLSLVDLSGVTCNWSVVNFNCSVLKNCDLSQATLFNAYFKKAVFLDVDMQNTRFDSVCFNDAVFINVNAENAVFENCSFQNVSFYNCNFNHAKMVGAFFITATISNCTFHGTNLSGASFAHSMISAVSFVESNLDQADFSGIKARFCRFPTHARAAVTMDGIDLNARKYQLELTDMPPLDETMVSKVNMLIFSEFIHYGESKFYRQNKHSLLTAFDIFKPRQSDLFRMIPFLLHTNIRLPGIKTSFHSKTPHGIHDYHPEPEILATISRYSKTGIPKTRIQAPAIEGLYTIGSIGSVAQTDDSDIDYWVCIYEDRLPQPGVTLLKKKLELIEAYALNQFRIHITFFLVDVNKSRQNDFGDSTTESSGSAQAMLLKEEFYRTMIHVAGKLPIWTVLPTVISKTYYDRISKTISSFPNLTRYIDLGDIHTISSGEFFGATIWQLFKSLKSPFKSVIKMALLEKYIHDAGEEPLLCNSVKDEWMNSGVNLKLAQNDAYYILLKNLLSYFNQSNDSESVSLLLTCFYMKLGIAEDADIDNSAFGLRKILLENCMEKWRWSRQQLLETGNYQSWPYKKIFSLSATLETYMVKKYKIVNNALTASGQGDIQISPEDRTVLGRKVYSELSKRSGKISKVLLVSNYETHFQGLNIKYNSALGKSESWELISRHTKSKGMIDTILTTKTIEEIGAWLVLNKIDEPSSIISLLPNPTQVTADDVIKLFNALDEHFSPVLKTPISFEQLLKKETLSTLFVCVNLYAPRHQEKITDYAVIYLNSWGEMFIKSWKSTQAFPAMDEMILHLKQQLDLSDMPVGTTFYSKGKPKLFNLYLKN